MRIAKILTITLASVIILGGYVLAADEPFVYDGKGKRDPFWPLVNPNGTMINYGSEIAASDMELEGIIVGSDGKNLAIVNGTIVKRFDKIGSYVVSKITKESVVLLKDKEEFVLQLKKED